MKSQDLTSNKLAIYGPYPPPIGGVSVHIQRMEFFLKEERIDYLIYNFGKYSGENIVATNKSPFWYFKVFFLKSYKLFHFHQTFIFEFVFYFFFSLVKNSKIIITIHAERLLKSKTMTKEVVTWFLKRTRNSLVISVSANLYEYLKMKGVNVDFVPAYVPPKEISLVKLGQEKKGRSYFLFSIWRFTRKNAKTIYNVHLAFNFLAKSRSRFKMLLMIGTKKGSDVDYLNSLLKSYDVIADVEIIFEGNLVDYVQNCAFLLRTNFVDGYGVSLQEAMDLGVPAIASNVCIRPKGTVLFEDNNLYDLISKVDWVCATPKKEVLSGKENLKYHMELIDKYKFLLKS